MAEPVRCEKCVEDGERSRVNVPQYGTTTAMMGHAYYDENGEYHSHDGNWWGAEWSCSRGHRWIVGTKAGCPAPGCSFVAERKVTWQ